VSDRTARARTRRRNSRARRHRASWVLCSHRRRPRHRQSVRPDDERLRDALGIAEREGLDYSFEKTKLGEEGVTHPNTARISLSRGDREAQLVGSSLGAGRILISEINGFPVEVTGNFRTMVLVAEDIRGSIATIARILADHGVNIANLKLTRKQRGGDAFMVIDMDDAPPPNAIEDVRGLAWVKWAVALDKVSA
jgi:L-serine dehydratase